MNKQEKQVIKNMYIEKLEALKLFAGSDHEKVLVIELNTIKLLAKSLLSNDELLEMKNQANVKVYYNNSKYLLEIIEGTFSWMHKIEKELGEKPFHFIISDKGIKRLYDHYDWLDRNQYKGFFANITLLQDYLTNKRNEELKK